MRKVGLAFGDQILRESFMNCLRTLRAVGTDGLVDTLSKSMQNWKFSSIETLLFVDGVEN